MKRTFRQLDQLQRDRIAALLRAGHEQVAIAGVLGVHPSTISREVLRRKKENGDYCPTVAQHKAQVLRSNSKHQGMKIERCPELRAYIVSELKHYQSPECIAGRMRAEQRLVCVSSDSIYRWLRSTEGQAYCKYLCTKRYKLKKHTNAPKRHMIPDMVSIHTLLPTTSDISEADTFLSPKKVSTVSGALVVWRASKLIKGDLIPNLKPKHMTRVMKAVHRKYHSAVMILDQGIENREHQSYGVPVVFCDPASPRQKPLVENTIGQLRKWWWPKGTNLAKVSRQEFQEKIEIMNNKYKKSLQYRSANEVSIECGIIKN
jgi:transposase, IS30 family